MKVKAAQLQPHGLCSPWTSPGPNTGVGSLSLLQVISPTQGWNPGLPHCRRILYQLSHQGSPRGGDTDQGKGLRGPLLPRGPRSFRGDPALSVGVPLRSAGLLLCALGSSVNCLPPVLLRHGGEGGCGRPWSRASPADGGALEPACCLPPHAGDPGPISQAAVGNRWDSTRARTPRSWSAPPARMQVLRFLSAAPTASPGRGVGRAGILLQESGVVPPVARGYRSGPQSSQSRSPDWGRLAGVACARRSAGLRRWDLGLGLGLPCGLQVLCVQTRLRRCKACRAIVVVACPPDPRPGDPQRSSVSWKAQSRPIAGADAEKPWGRPGHLQPEAGLGGPWPPPTAIRVGVHTAVPDLVREAGP